MAAKQVNDKEWLIKYMYGRRQKQVKLKLSNELNQAEQWFFKQEENKNLTKDTKQGIINTNIILCTKWIKQIYVHIRRTHDVIRYIKTKQWFR